jgi:hypothetical protein
VAPELANIEIGKNSRTWLLTLENVGGRAVLRWSIPPMDEEA